MGRWRRGAAAAAVPTESLHRHLGGLLGGWKESYFLENKLDRRLLKLVPGSAPLSCPRGCGGDSGSGPFPHHLTCPCAHAPKKKAAHCSIVYHC